MTDQDKASLRTRLTLWRDALAGPERAVRSAAATARLRAHPVYQRANSLMVYVSFRSELETWHLIQAALDEGKVVTVPKVEKQPRGLLACRLREFPGPLRSGAYGILEPGPEAVEVWPPGELDLVIVPGLGFDRGGRRLGYGGGYYDRFLAGAASQAIALGLCFEEQVLDAIPADPHDRPMDLVVTDGAVYGGDPS